MNDEDYSNDTPDDQVSFVGPCTCEHDAEQHGWTGCAAEDCACEAHWEE